MKLIVALLLSAVSLSAFPDEKNALRCADLREQLKSVDNLRQQPQAGQQPEESDPVATTLKAQKSAMQDEMKTLNCNPF
ncbi:MAG TPA: hypothetical protein VFW00_08405 [Rhodocyclaceae bacterium]|nr:hypothetical protein [Rhodocyclaceae bacterium]